MPYIKKYDKLIYNLQKQKERAKNEMLEAACVTDINTTLMRAGEQTAFDLCIKMVEVVYGQKAIIKHEQNENKQTQQP